MPNHQKTYLNRFVKFLEPRFHAHYADNYNEGALLGGTQIGLRHTGSCRLPNLKTDGVKQLLIQYSSKNPGGILQIRAGGIDGKIVLKVKLDSTSKGKL